MATEKQALSVREAADVLGISPDTVRRLAARGALRTIRIARLVKVPRSECDKILRDGVGPHAAKSGRAK